MYICWYVATLYYIHKAHQSILRVIQERKKKDTRTHITLHSLDQQSTVYELVSLNLEVANCLFLVKLHAKWVCRTSQRVPEKPSLGNLGMAGTAWAAIARHIWARKLCCDVLRCAVLCCVVLCVAWCGVCR